MPDNDLPRQEFLRPGVYVATIVHAIFVTRAPNMYFMNSWDADTYCVNDMEGRYGAITFAEHRAVAAFRNDKSKRIWDPSNRHPDAFKRYYRGAPDDLRTLAVQEACQYLFDEIDGQEFPFLTTGFWVDGETEWLCAAEDWPFVYAHGAEVVRIQLLPIEQAIDAWIEDCELSEAEADFAMNLFGLRDADHSEIIELPSEQRAFLKELASSAEGWNACAEALGDISIKV